MIVDGQVYGGAAQGIGTALYEEMPFSDDGQPLASTLADYLLPGATEVPAIRIEHMETPAPYTEFGQKGLGESGAIGPPAAIANAVNDALRGLGAQRERTADLAARGAVRACRGARRRSRRARAFDPVARGGMKAARFEYVKAATCAEAVACSRKATAWASRWPVGNRWVRC